MHESMRITKSRLKPSQTKGELKCWCSMCEDLSFCVLASIISSLCSLGLNCTWWLFWFPPYKASCSFAIVQNSAKHHCSQLFKDTLRIYYPKLMQFTTTTYLNIITHPFAPSIPTFYHPSPSPTKTFSTKWSLKVSPCKVLGEGNKLGENPLRYTTKDKKGLVLSNVGLSPPIFWSSSKLI
jgi:hypothetical protein